MRINTIGFDASIFGLGLEAIPMSKGNKLILWVFADTTEYEIVRAKKTARKDWNGTGRINVIALSKNRSEYNITY
jgi:hypothetical protein